MLIPKNRGKTQQPKTVGKVYYFRTVQLNHKKMKSQICDCLNAFCNINLLFVTIQKLCDRVFKAF